MRVAVPYTTVPSRLNRTGISSRTLVYPSAPFVDHREPLRLVRAQRQNDPSSGFDSRFQHLQRLIVVDDEARRKWQAAFAKGEVECEKLGAVHLLGHGIWAFKIDARGGRTDLVYQEPAGGLIKEQQYAEGFVLTGWKIAKRLTENELSDFSYLWHDGCAEAITEAQDVDRNHSAEV
jgi:hypothetical protein